MQRFFRYRGCISEELKKQNHNGKNGHFNFAGKRTSELCFDIRYG